MSPEDEYFTRRAWRILDGNFIASKPRRFVEGVAVGSSNLINDCRLFARAVHVRLPALLLVQHAWECPVGRVLTFKPRGEQIIFRAEIANSRRLDWCDLLWQSIVERRAADRVSVQVRANGPLDESFKAWRLAELSVLDVPADPDAAILRCWEARSGFHIEHWDRRLDGLGKSAQIEPGAAASANIRSLLP